MKIGAPDAKSYFLNILPLEIRILERRQETGEDVRAELKRLRRALKKKDVSVITKDLLPDNWKDGGKKPRTKKAGKEDPFG